MSTHNFPNDAQLRMEFDMRRSDMIREAKAQRLANEAQQGKERPQPVQNTIRVVRNLTATLFTALSRAAAKSESAMHSANDDHSVQPQVSVGEPG
jgi:hypothetical protein